MSRRRDDLIRAIAEIARTPLQMRVQDPGPNSWDWVKDDRTKFGPEEDYRVFDHGDRRVFEPVSEAALQWAYAKFPENAPRFGVRGFIFEEWGEILIREAAERDGLMSYEEFYEAMMEEEELQRGQ